MDQSESSKQKGVDTNTLSLPPRSLTTEFYVGFFTIISFAAIAYLSVGLGEVNLFQRAHYQVTAVFDNVSGLKEGASVEIAGVKIGDVAKISLDDQGEFANVVMRIQRRFTLRDEDIAAVRTKGIIGDRFVKVVRGSLGAEVIPPGGRLVETESVVEFEDLIGKIISNLTSDSESAGG